MKYKVDDVLFTRLYEKNQKGRKVVDIKQFGEGSCWSYKFESKETKSGFVWAPEWMLYTKDEFLVEVRNGTLLAMTTIHATFA